ncbi:MAG: DUF308 domain-containing protein [Prevotella sp.]|nr:DUF308 domain-containing protein [Prevotella sp.]
MRILQSSIFRALLAIAVGAMLIKYPDNTVTGITVAIGIMFLLSGLISLLTYWNARRHASEYKIYDADGRLLSGGEPTFPIVGIGSMLLGCILAFMPTTFVSALMYVIGAVLVLGAVTQMMNLIGARRFAAISGWFWVLPVLTLLAGIYIMVKPLAPVELAMTALGWLSLLYGIAEVINSWKIYACRKAMERMAEAASEAEPETTLLEDEAARQ